MNPKRKIILSCILITLINITTLLYTYLPLSVKQRIPFNLQLRLLSAALFYFFQLYLLYHVAKSSSKAIYIFPFHWMIELWRNLAYVGFCSVTQPPKLYRISSLVWMGDFFPCTYTPYISIPHSPVRSAACWQGPIRCITRMRMRWRDSSLRARWTAMCSPRRTTVSCGAAMICAGCTM